MAKKSKKKLTPREKFFQWCRSKLLNLTSLIWAAVIALAVGVLVAWLLPGPRITAHLIELNSIYCTQYLFSFDTSATVDMLYLAMEFPEDISDYRVVAVSRTATELQGIKGGLGPIPKDFKIPSPIRTNHVTCRITAPDKNILPPGFEVTLSDLPARTIVMKGSDVHDSVFATLFGREKIPHGKTISITAYYKTTLFGLPQRKNITVPVDRPDVSNF